jgi:hypothetical protein
MGMAGNSHAMLCHGIEKLRTNLPPRQQPGREQVVDSARALVDEATNSNPPGQMPRCCAP